MEEKHPDRAGVGEALVRRLIEKQFPRWAGLSVTGVASAGTDNAIFRLGADLAVRLPRHRVAAESLANEWQWLPRLSPSLPLAIPVPVGQGAAGDGFPSPWSVHQWALALGVGAVDVYQKRNPVLAATGRRSIAEVLTERSR